MSGFEEAVKLSKRLRTKPSNDELQMLYGLYKQRMFGDCNAPEPGFLDFVGKTKWYAWNKWKGIDPKVAGNKYVDYVGTLVEKYGVSDA